MAKKSNSLTYEVVKGLWNENPVLIQLLGLCPTLAVTNSAVNGVAMGLATTFVLLCSSILISVIRKIIPAQVRIASYIVVIATFVTVVDKFLAAYTPDISKALGAFIPLIVVNCLILGRQEAFASKNNVGRSILDGIGMGIGFTWVLTLLGMIRELLGEGSIFAISIMPESFNTWLVMILPPGAFLTLGIFIGLSNWINERRVN
ncbi:MAG: electron transport complex subunit E [Candidatus Marinimicrobia bacterium]|nr:electron transport complex subunit E [Candidatus Neomarinimicrobiota bacterium]MBL7022861.1 electron transport complex subunit E [Candidatus Neomarinimicrobiota bacterium]MBL7110039.1 electron transport complex subunit E [Candidatus Neomarinimicrobiota bacterium]